MAKRLKEMAVQNARAILRNYERISPRDVDADPFGDVAGKQSFRAALVA